MGEFRFKHGVFHELKRAFPLSSFRQKSPISKNEDERNGTPPVYVSFAWPTPLLEHIWRRQICFFLIRSMVFGDTMSKIRWDEDISLHFLVGKKTNIFNHRGMW